MRLKGRTSRCTVLVTARAVEVTMTLSEWRMRRRDAGSSWSWGCLILCPENLCLLYRTEGICRTLEGDQKVEGRARRRRKVDTIGSKRGRVSVYRGRASVYHTELYPTEASTDFPGHTVISTCQLKFVSTASHSIRTMAFTVHLSSGSPTCYNFTCDLKYARRPPRPLMHIGFTRDGPSSGSESEEVFKACLLINRNKHSIYQFRRLLFMKTSYFQSISPI